MPYAPSKDLDRSTQIVRRGRMFGAHDKYTPGVANASSFRVIAASIAALVRAIRRAPPFLFRALCGVGPVSPPRINSIAAMTEKQRFRLRENTRQRSSNRSASAAAGRAMTRKNYDGDERSRHTRDTPHGS